MFLQYIVSIYKLQLNRILLDTLIISILLFLIVKFFSLILKVTLLLLKYVLLLSISIILLHELSWTI